MARERNSAVKFYTSGKIAKDLTGITDSVDGVLKGWDTAVVRAVSGLRRRAVPAGVRAVRENYNVKASAVRSRVRLEGGTRRARRSDRSEFISIWASTRRLPLLEFGGRWGGMRTKGARAQVVRGQSKVYAGAFIATVQGLRAIRTRRLDSATGKRHGRGPLQMLRGPSVFEMLSGLDHAPARRSRDAVLEELTTFYRSELRRQWALQRGRRG
jgi:hypothetical protein